VQPLCTAIWRFVKKLKIEVTCSLAILLLGIYLKEYKSEYNRDACTPMFITVLFTIAKLWKQPKCPTTDEWIKKMYVYVCIYAHMSIMLFAGKWMELEIIMFSEVS
jgi:hypothetical protein